jgi:hypothetical protein
MERKPQGGDISDYATGGPQRRGSYRAVSEDGDCPQSSRFAERAGIRCRFPPAQLLAFEPLLS